MLLPGGILPAEAAYGALLPALGSSVDPRPKELEIYASELPPADYSLATEIKGIARAADAAGFERFHLVGYSAGGAASLAFVASHSDRVLSLAVMEPAFAGWQGMTDAERAHFERFRALLDQDGPEMLAAFQALQLAPGVAPVLPPPGPAPAWMASRPRGVHALLRTFLASDLDLAALQRFDRPVSYMLGGRSHPDYYARMADRLAVVFPDLSVEVFPDRHHFDPPHRIEPARVATLLRSLWDRAERG
jgi:pimeloyl-ACP methyl ester carboxylesterase